ncbi:hypothetical protein ACIRS1_02030 [Kitasatospora sp. NPDC101176]|uniref:hypothetical protein n=1 Tax=Kitasatospora sp. NPDC101176 TaxID=3364099 RepID=UPI0037F24B08
MDESQSGGETTCPAAGASPVRRGARRLRAVRGGREWAGWILLAVGAVLCVLGWYGVSGERFAEQQIPYLASSTVPGAALIVSGAVLVAVRPPPPDGPGDLTGRRVARLYELLVEPDEPQGGGGAATGWCALPGGTHYHRPDCPLVSGKERAGAVDAAAVRDRSLTPCPVCEPGGDPDGPATRPGESAPPGG